MRSAIEQRADTLREFPLNLMNALHLRRPILLAASVIAVLLGNAAVADETTGNLLVNGDAESHRCTDDWTAQSPVPGWTVVRGAATVLCYSAFAYAQETPALPPGGSPGQALFAAPGADTAIEQTVDVGNAAEAIDRGGVRYTLSGWLGGWRNRPERATLTAIFLNQEGDATGTPVIIASADAAARHNQTGLVARSAQGPVPPQTRRIVVTVDFLSAMTSFHNAYADNLGLTLQGDVLGLAPPSGPKAPVSRVPALDHVFVVMMENTNYADVIHTTGRSISIDAHMPFLSSLASSGVVLTDLWGTYHPSDQNYVAMVAGDTYEYGPVYYPNFDLTVTHLGDLLDAQGKSWRGYVQHMKTPCNLNADSNGGWFAPDDEPFAQFQDVIGDPARCVTTLRDLKDFEAAISARSLPDFAWIAADGWWDGEGAWYQNYDVGFSLAKQDQFLKSAVGNLIGSPAWNASRSLLIVTWDESDGWGWPDNHVPTILVGSPGLLKEGAKVDSHYDGYGVLRTIESAFGLDGLDRFDEFATPLNDVFAGVEQGAPGRLSASEAVATRGRLVDTFGQVATPAAVDPGQPITLIASAATAADASVALEPVGQAPNLASPRYALQPDGSVAIPTDGLAAGHYGAWLLRGQLLPSHAPLPVLILPSAQVSANAPGVEIVGAPTVSSDAIEVREGSNLTVRYCRPANLSAPNAWIGVFAAGTPSDQMTQGNTNLISNWLKTPGGESDQSCGEASAFVSELAPGTQYEILLFKNASSGASVSIGRSASFTVTPSLPQ